MNVIKSRFVYHLMAIITVAIWGTTFVSTKILIQHGLLKNLSVDIHNTALASPGGTYYADAEVTMEVPVRFAGKILSNMSVRLKVRAAYREKF